MWAERYQPTTDNPGDHGRNTAILIPSRSNIIISRGRGVLIFRRDARLYCKGASNAEPKMRTDTDIATI